MHVIIYTTWRGRDWRMEEEDDEVEGCCWKKSRPPSWNTRWTTSSSILLISASLLLLLVPSSSCSSFLLASCERGINLLWSVVWCDGICAYIYFCGWCENNLYYHYYFFFWVEYSVFGISVFGRVSVPVFPTFCCTSSLIHASHFHLLAIFFFFFL